MLSTAHLLLYETVNRIESFREAAIAAMRVVFFLTVHDTTCLSAVVAALSPAEILECREPCEQHLQDVFAGVFVCAI